MILLQCVEKAKESFRVMALCGGLAVIGTLRHIQPDG